MVIYTKRGDKGETSLYDAEGSQRIRVSKDSLKVNTLGAIDELNSYIGVTIATSDNMKLNKVLYDVQKNLLTVGSIVAGSKLPFFGSKTKLLEKLIDEIEGKLPPLKNFILPGGPLTSANLQYCRSLTRRAERALVALNKKESVKAQILVFINRLSDFFFMLARQENYNEGVNDTVWLSGKKK